MSAATPASLPTLGRPLSVLGIEFFATSMHPVPDVPGAWLLFLLPPTTAPTTADRIAALRDVPTEEVLEQARVALNVLSTRFSEGRDHPFYAANRAIAEVEQVSRFLSAADEEDPT